MKTFTELLEDTYTSEYKIKKVLGPDGKWHDHKLRPHRIDFKNSKMHGEPAQKDSGQDVGMKEETMTIDEQINEVLSKDATAGDWIHDFVHSDNPKFEGKSKEKRKQMALAAYYAKQQNEQAPVAPVPDKKYIKGTPEHKAYKATKKPINGMPTNVKEGTMKSFKEMLQSLDEKSDQAKQNKTMKNMMDASRGARYKVQNKVSADDVRDWDGKHPTPRAQNVAIGRALRNEDKKEDPPFDGPYTKSPGNVKDKSGAVHTPMSRARDLARQAMKKQMKEEQGVDLTDEQADELMIEALVGGQVKLDKNKNGKIDSGDLKMVRGEECPECGKAPCECGHMKEDTYAGLEALKKMGLPTAARSSHPRGVNIDTVEGWDHPHDAVKKKEVKEETDVETRTLSFSDFMSQLNEYNPGPGGVTRVQGRSYGAQYRDPEGEDDAEDKKKQVAKSEPAIKRGRGRPAGSKSGANQKVTTGRKGSGVDYTGYKLHLPNSNR